ncbi:hypothetical protein HPP92_009556 [Vanilla planifolia]|uniref:Pentatricopeptide repeat-containing protein-mitochondrial domain-containing protein n=2 Tax=Vanilla planifolia TaxID=51239 RepID=A0A835RFY3_VANPL|nr:hypothetical protein HPP92_009556 [Vanilla planifolia]
MSLAYRLVGWLFICNRHLSSSSSSPTPVDPSLLLRLCTVLYQQQHAPDPKLHSHLLRLTLPSSPHSIHELFLQVCNRFPFSYRPPHRLHLFLLSHSSFSPTPVSAAKLLDVIGKSRNIALLWDHLRLTADRRLLSLSSLRVAARVLADAQETSKCVRLFYLDPQFLSLGALNAVVETLCRRRHVNFANDVVRKLRGSIAANEETYKLLIVGFCKAGELMKAARLWNMMVAEGLEPEVDAYLEIVVTLFKSNRSEDAMRLFKSMRETRFLDLNIVSYRTVIDWTAKVGKMPQAYMVFAEMLKKGIGLNDGATLGALVYGLLARKKVKEAYRVFQEAREVDRNLCHGLMKGLLRLRRPAEATEVLREMVRRRVEPNMHTYVMILQGHMGKRGRKGKDEMVNFESIFVGGLVKAGNTLEASKYAERTMHGAMEVPRFDYNRFLQLFSDEEGVEMFEMVGRRLKEVGMADLGDVFLLYGQRMATRERRRKAMVECREA